MLFLTFIPLRVYAGGYHADTRLTCFIVSLVVYCVFTVLLKVIPIKLHYLFILIDIVTNLLLVILFAPIVHKNKSVNNIERKHYRKFSVNITLLEIFIISMVLLMTNNSFFALSLASGQMAVAFSMIMAFLKEKFTANK